MDRCGLVDRSHSKNTYNIRCHQHCRSVTLTGILFMFCACLAGTLGWLFWKLDTPRLIFQSAGMRVIVSTGDLQIVRDGHRLLSGSLGLASTNFFRKLCREEDWSSFDHFDEICEQLCAYNVKAQSNSFCSIYGKMSMLKVETIPSSNKSIDGGPVEEVTCHKVSWETSGCHERHIEDCFCVGEGYWYGGSAAHGLPDLDEGQPSRQIKSPWASRPHEATATCGHEQYEAVHHSDFSEWEEKYLLSSRGLAIHVPQDIAISLRYYYKLGSPGAITRICLRARAGGERNTDGYVLGMNYTLCYGDNMKTTHSHMLAHHLLPQPASSAGARNLPVEPLWDIPMVSDHQAIDADDMSALQDFQRQLAKHNFTSSLAVFHGSLWEDYMNSVIIKQIIPEAYLKSFWRLPGISIEVHPFVRLNSPMFFKLSTRGHFMLDESGVVILAKWQKETCALIDFNNSSSIAWFTQRMHHLQTSVRSLSVTPAPRAFNLLRHLVSEGRLSRNRAQSFVTSFLSVLAEVVGTAQGMVAVRSTSKVTNNLPARNNMFVEMPEVEHLDAGALIREALRLSVLGVSRLQSPRLQTGPRVVCSALRTSQDMTASEYTQWALAASLLPAFLLPLPPWCLNGTNTAQPIQDIITQRRSLLSSIQEDTPAHKLAQALAIRPLWWLEPTDQVCHEAKNHIVLGDKLIVLPAVLGKADVYLPNGTWLEMFHRKTFVGGQWIKDYHIPRGKYAIFNRLATG